MADLLEQGSTWLDQQRVQHMSRTVSYHRGAESVAVQATIGRTVFEVDDGMGILERIESRDFLIITADLVLAGQAILPQRGDRIKETSGDKVYVYEVLAPGKEPHYRFSDPYRKTLRIHSKQVDLEDVP